MAHVDIDLEDYVDELSTTALVRELLDRAGLHKPAAERHLADLRDAIAGGDREDWEEDVHAAVERLREAWDTRDVVAFERALQDLLPPQTRHLREKRQREMYAAALGRTQPPAAAPAGAS